MVGKEGHWLFTGAVTACEVLVLVVTAVLAAVEVLDDTTTVSASTTQHSRT